MNDRAETLSRRFAQVLDPYQVERVRGGVPVLAADDAVLKLKPTSVEQVAAILRVANEERAVLVPTGNGSALHLGNLPSQVDALLSLRGLGGTVDFEPKDLTVVAQAGRMLATLQDELGRAGQFLALDPPNHRRATLGGIVATNQSGPLRRTYGAPRDLTLGVKVVLPDGSVVKGGGRVVKNVAGYDTTKLHVGGLGTLGVIVEAAFRLHPLPETYGGALATFRSWEDATDAANGIIHSELHPLFVEVLNLGDSAWDNNASNAFVPALLVAFAGRKDAVDYQTSRVHAIASEHNVRSADALDAHDVSRWHALIAAVVDAAHHDERVIVCRVGTVIADVRATLETVSRLAESRSVDVQSLAHYANGIVLSRMRPDDAESVVDMVEHLRKEMAPLNGSVVVESAPGEVKRLLDVWGSPASPLAWMRLIKSRFDPRRVLNRGRFIRGLDDESPA
jgi:glycolate oxidase FAD binding subunit